MENHLALVNNLSCLTNRQSLSANQEMLGETKGLNGQKRFSLTTSQAKM
jgi:hypothetical protein